MAVNRVLQEEFARLDWTRVSSSNVEAVAWTEVGNLWVRFLPGPGRGKHTVYVYLRVPRGVFEALASAASVGGYLAKNVKGVYGYIAVM